MPDDTPKPGHSAIRRHIAARFPRGSAAGKTLRWMASGTIAAARAVAAPALTGADAVRLAHVWRTGGPGIGQSAHGRSIVMLVVSDVHGDPRVRQEARALAAAGFDLVIVWPELPDRQGLPIDWGPGIRFQPLPPSAGRFAYRVPGVLGCAMLDAALVHRPFAFHGHDLTTALIALTAARATGAHAVCDFHEWFSEHVTWSDRRGVYVPLSRGQRALNKRLERLAFTDASAVVTVCDSIATAMDQEYGDGTPRVHVVRNISAPSAAVTDGYPSLRQQLNLQRQQFLVLYQGGIGPSRALEPVIRALAHAPEVVLAIRGPSIEHYAAHYRAVASAAGVSASRLALLPPVPSTDVVAACHGADAGLYTVADLCKSFTCALPNKVFEYMRAGLPVLTADYPEVRRMVVETGAGLAFDPQDPKSIAAAMRAVLPTAVRAGCVAGGRAILAQIDKTNEWDRLVHLYQALPRAVGSEIALMLIQRPGQRPGQWPVGREAAAVVFPRQET